MLLQTKKRIVQASHTPLDDIGKSSRIFAQYFAGTKAGECDYKQGAEFGHSVLDVENLGFSIGYVRGWKTARQAHKR